MNNFKQTERSLVVTGQPTIEQWGDFWTRLKENNSQLPFILGDLLNYGELTYGDLISQYLDPDGEGHFSVGSLRQYKYVTGRWPASSRIYKLSFSFYQVTTGLELEQRQALMQHTVDHGIRRAELRQLVRELNDGKNDNPPALPDDTNELLAQENYQLEQENERLKEQLEVKQAVIQEEDLPDYALQAIANLENWLLECGGYSGVTVYKNGDVKWLK